MAVPYVFVANTTIEPDQVNDNFAYVLNEATGGLLIDGSNAMQAPLNLDAGTLALPSLTFDGDTNTGIYRSGADTFVFVAGGVAQATVSTAGLTVTAPWAISAGGTGAATASAARTALGVGTGDSPEFLALNIGAATDTTVTRSSAGNLAVEGNLIYRAGGTDVPLSDGGTGASDASGARTNLGLGSLATASSVNDSNWSGTDLAVANGGTGASTADAARTNLAAAPTPTSSTLPVDFCGFMRYTASGSLSDGSTTAGSNVQTLAFTGTFGSTSLEYKAGQVQTGTWKNISGATMSGAGTDNGNAVGLMVRTA